MHSFPREKPCNPTPPVWKRSPIHLSGLLHRVQALLQQWTTLNTASSKHYSWYTPYLGIQCLSMHFEILRAMAPKYGTLVCFIKGRTRGNYSRIGVRFLYPWLQNPWFESAKTFGPSIFRAPASHFPLHYSPLHRKNMHSTL